MTVLLAEKMGFPSLELEVLRQGALLHDIGKVGVPDSILLKPCSLTREEWEVMKQHPIYASKVISTIEQYAPNIRKAIVGMQVISPKDIEAIAGITGGNIFHGELLLHQIFFLRPTPQWADFRTPLKGYYFGASGAHPGGGVMGAAGMLAAKEILKDGL